MSPDKSETQDFLFELGTEELPPKSLLALATSLREQVEIALADLSLSFDSIEHFATPRRLALIVTSLQTRQADQRIERRGPAVQAAFDENGQPTKAALGFARSCGVDLNDLQRLKTDKGEWLAYSANVAGASSSQLLPEVMHKALAALPIAKRMRWGAGDSEFVRPVHWLVAMLGNEIIEMELFGIRAGDSSRGHRFHCPQSLTIANARDYVTQLKAGHVIASFEQRRALIKTLAEDTAREHGGTAIIDPNLLDEVTGLVEWPVPISGSFDAHFLALPREVLIISMQDHQKYFPLENLSGELMNQFITISNIESTDPEEVRRGNERVIRPRLSDATFFWDQDRQTPLAARLDSLDKVVFEKRLGSLKDKTTRVSALAELIAAECGIDIQDTARAANLSRCDLLSTMVGEFPALQGIIGGYYAAADGETQPVASALREFYMPRFASDEIPASSIGRCIALADKLDTLVGIFGIGAAPTGDKDPFALRRAAIGALRIMIEGEVTLDLARLLTEASANYAVQLDKTDLSEPVFQFMMERLRGYYGDKGIEAAVLDAVLAAKPTRPHDINARIAAVESFQQMPQAAALAAANKRIRNILKKTPNDEITFDSAHLKEVAERQLAEHLLSLEAELDLLWMDAAYTEYLRRLATIKEMVDEFFDQVMVMCEDPVLQRNRLALLQRMQTLFSRVADISRL